MKSKAIAALSAGLAGGVILAAYDLITLALSLVFLYMNNKGVETVTGVCGCLSYPVAIAVALGVGVLAVMWAKNVLTTLADAAIAAALAGALAGLIYGVVSVAVAFLVPLIVSSSVADSTDYVGSLAVGSFFGVASGVENLCCCAPMWLVAIAILAAIGGVIYASVKLKLQ